MGVIRIGPAGYFGLRRGATAIGCRMPLSALRILAAATVLIFHTSPTQAQEQIEEQAQESVAPVSVLGLATLKGKFTEDMRAAMAPAGVQYLAQLKKIERQYALEGKFEEAMAARDEAAAVTDFLGDALDEAIAAIEAGNAEALAPAESGVTKLANTAADISAGAQFTDGGLTLDTGGATATWKLDDSHQPGGYEVVISYSSEEDVTVQIRESFFRLSGELPGTAGEKSSLSLGSLKITSRSDSVSLINTAGDDGGSSELIIHSVQLISAKD